MASSLSSAAEEHNTPQLCIDKNSNNYRSWKEQMLRIMESQGLLGFVDGGAPPPPPTDDQDYAAWRRTDGLLRGWILGTVSHEVAQTLSKFDSARDIWVELESYFSLSEELDSPQLRGDKNSNNYISWKEQMVRIMESQGLLGFIDGGAPPPPPTDDQGYVAWRRRDALLKGWILGSLSQEVSQTLSKFGSARDIWLELENYFAQSKANEWNNYLPLYRATLKGDWHSVKAILDQDSGATAARIADTLETALHVAVSSGKSASFLAKLVDCMSDDSLSITDSIGFNPLHGAALTGNLAAAKILVHRLPSLLYVPCQIGRFPVQWAADAAHRPTLEFLLSHTRDDMQNNPFAGEPGLLLLCFMIDADYFDLALNLVEKYPVLARMNHPEHDSALVRIAMNESAFSMDHEQFNFWDRFIYSVTRAKRIHEKKMVRQQALNLVKCLCKHMEPLKHEAAAAIYRSAIITASRSGIHEILEVIVETFPTAIYSRDDATDQNYIHFAVRNRCERVFNLLYQTGNHRFHYANGLDSSGNSILHLAAILAPPHKLNLVSGAALQMQRELQWFKEVDKFISPYNREGRNEAGKTPKMIFTEEHKELKVEGEKWMKDTANSCSIAAALIATVVFAAAITVPGGNESRGYPMFSNASAFTIFAVSDAISLFTSTTSLMMFLSILTARYAEEDFLYALPKRLCIGLVTLFLSILFMMAAFSSTLYLVFGRKHAWVLLPVGALAFLPISSFALLQFPLLIDVVSSTYGRGIFGKQSDRRFH